MLRGLVFRLFWPMLLLLLGPLPGASAVAFRRIFRAHCRLPTDDVPGNVSNCTSRSAAIHNLTIYGAEILYTTLPAGTSLANLTNNTSPDTATSFEFQMYNAVLDVDAQCSAHVPFDPDGSGAAVWHTCFVESRDMRITAAFRFDLRRHELAINETWICDGTNDLGMRGGGDTGTNTTAVTFQAWATNSFATLCPETVNEDIGQHYCARVANGPLPVNVTRRVENWE